MRTTRNQAQLVHKADGRRLHLAFDLGNSRWHLAFSDGTRERFCDHHRSRRGRVG